MSPGTPPVSPQAVTGFFQSLPPFALIALGGLALLFAALTVTFTAYQVCNWKAEVKSASDFFFVICVQPSGALICLRLGLPALRSAGVL